MKTATKRWVQNLGLSERMVGTIQCERCLGRPWTGRQGLPRSKSDRMSVGVPLQFVQSGLVTHSIFCVECSGSVRVHDYCLAMPHLVSHAKFSWTTCNSKHHTRVLLTLSDET